MGLRQASKTAIFLAQSKAGAEEQQKARERLKKPQALGGAASAGTQMIAASTGAQQQATQQVQKTGQEAVGALKVDETKVPSSTQQMITGTSMQGQPTQSSVATTYKPPDEIKLDTGESGDIEKVDASAKSITDAIAITKNTLDDLNNKLKTAEGEDRKALLDEKSRLDSLLQDYQNKLLKENLGQIAGPSDIEQQLAEREELLASRGQNVAKLASIFGPGWNAKRYGALASQIYGKDLENIQDVAASGLEQKAIAERQADTATEQYEEGLKTSKKAYEENIDKESKKLDILNKSTEELTGYTRKELSDLFGENVVDQLFKFKDGKVIGTTVSETRKALNDRLTQLTDESLKVDQSKSKAVEVASKKLSEIYYPTDQYGAPQQSIIEQSRQSVKRLPNSLTKTTKRGLGKTETRAHLGSQSASLEKKYDDRYAALDNQLRDAIKNGNTKEANRIAQTLLPQLVNEHQSEINNIIDNLRSKGYK